MFEAVTQKLRTIDTVLNEATVKWADGLDIRGGFDPARVYTDGELENIFPNGPEALKRTGKGGKYLLLEVRLTEGTQSFSQLYLRGFDYIMIAHPTVAEAFLNNDLIPTIGEYFELPDQWPGLGSHRTPRTVEVEKDGLNLTVTALGGGKFDLKEGRINLKDSSEVFGPVPEQYQEQFRAMLELLVQKPTYQAYGGEHPILAEYRRFMGESILKGFNPAEAKLSFDYLAACLNPNTPPHLLSLPKAGNKAFVFYSYLGSIDQQRLMQLVEQIEAILLGRGYREDILTYQEHKLLGSSEWAKCADNPYTPTGVLEGKLKTDEANRARQLQRRSSARGKYFGSSEGHVSISLEPLDSNGVTVRDPQLLNDKLEYVPAKQSNDFPFKRV